MAITQVSDMGDSVKTRYEKAYLLHGDQNPGVWGQFVSWQKPVSEGGDGGSAFEFPVYDAGVPLQDAISETADITPQTMDDGNVSVTPAEYGGSFSTTKKLRYQAHTNLPEVCRQESRRAARHLHRPHPAPGRGGAWQHLPDQHRPHRRQCRDDSLDLHHGRCDLRLPDEPGFGSGLMGLEPFKGMGYVAPIHPTLANDILQLTEFKTVGYYQDSANLYSPWGRPFTLGNITFIPTPRGKLYLGSGGNATGGADDVTTEAIAVGGTTVKVTQCTLGAAVGDYVTLEVPETEATAPTAKTEQGQVISIANTNDLTVRFNGANEDWGARFAHDSGIHVTVCYNVAAIPLLGHGLDPGRLRLRLRAVWQDHRQAGRAGHPGAVQLLQLVQLPGCHRGHQAHRARQVCRLDIRQGVELIVARSIIK